LARAQLSREVSASKEMMAASDKVTSCSRLSVSWWSRRAVELRRAFSAGSATEGAAAGGKMTSMSSFLLTRGPFRSRSATSVGVASVTVAVTCVPHCPLTRCGACRALLRSGDSAAAPAFGGGGSDAAVLGAAASSSGMCNCSHCHSWYRRVPHHDAS
jgi:hypothetical protein